MSTTQWTRGDVCGIDNCQSRYWQIVDGRLYCRNGHQKEGDLEIGEDDDDYMQRGRSHYTRSQESVQEQETTTYYGVKGYTLFVQCYQIHLRNQVAALIQHLNAPAEIETVVKGLWELYVVVSGVSEQLSLHLAEGDGYSTDEMGPGSGSSTPQTPRTPRTPEAETEAETAGEDYADSGGESLYVSSASSEESGDDVKRPASDEDEDEDDGEGAEDDRTTLAKLAGLSLAGRAKRRRRNLKKVRLADSVALLYFACRLVDVPIALADLYSAARNMVLPYMHAGRGLPAAAWRHLEQKYRSVFEPVNYPAPGVFHEASVRLAAALKSRFRLRVPAPAPASLLYRFVHDLLLPLEVYQGARRLAALLELPAEVAGASNGSRHPEILTMAVVVVAAKLCYGFDGVERAAEAAEPAGYGPDWARWQAALVRLWVREDWERSDDVTARRSRMGDVHERMGATDDVAVWPDADVDRFLEFYRATWLAGPDEPSLPPQKMLGLFPLPAAAPAAEPGDDVVAELAAVQATTAPAEAAAAALRPAEAYPVYRINYSHPELDPDFDPRLSVLVVAGSKMCGASVMQLRRAVRLSEALALRHVRG
ncbi:uncharacterized protein V1510DRAFT_431431 [Dipodascopsis tothii]|uniref:uncharacterized protein n=1 Tax=Dipodascopsis tothii TaxID=44089 RepID=UPI0034CDE29F